MQRTDQFHDEDMIDLGDAAVVTKGVASGLPEDTDGQLPPFRIEPGLSVD